MRLKGLILISASLLLLACCKGSGGAETDSIFIKDSMIEKLPMAGDGIVRLSKIEVYPEYLPEYMEFAKEVGETSLKTESGVLTMYAMQDKSDSCRITILETYTGQDAYESHIASAHFQKYKQGTLHMVKSLSLEDQSPLNPHSRLTQTVPCGTDGPAAK